MKVKQNKVKNIIHYIILFPRKLEIFVIDLYKRYISPSLGSHCKYYPTCSVYVREAVDKYGIIEGNILGIYRIIRCNPFSQGGVDLLKWNEVCKWYKQYHPF